MKDGYVIVYDEPDQTGEAELEQYYGYFDSPVQAELLWKQLNKDGKLRYNAHLCKIVKELT